MVLHSGKTHYLGEGNKEDFQKGYGGRRGPSVQGKYLGTVRVEKLARL